MNLAGSSITCGIETRMASKTRRNNSVIKFFVDGTLLFFLIGNTLKKCKMMPIPKLTQKASEILSNVLYNSRSASLSKNASSMISPRLNECVFALRRKKVAMKYTSNMDKIISVFFLNEFFLEIVDFTSDGGRG